MKALSWLLLLVLMLTPAGLSAQDSADQAADPKQEVAEPFWGLMFAKHHGYVATHPFLGQSFAARLHGTEAPLTPEALSTFGAAYDPITDTPLSAGMAYFHLALPIGLLREIGGGGNEILARILEARIRWLAGDLATARFQIEDLVIQIEAIGMADAQMVSVLADASVLAWRDGDAKAARAYLARAQVCKVARCPGDLVFDWLGSAPKADAAPYPGFDADRLRDHALAEVDALVAAPQQMRAEIEAEWRFVTGQWGDALNAAIAQAGRAGSDALTQTDQQQIRGIADRIHARNDLLPYLLANDSVAGTFSDLTDSEGNLSVEKLRASGLSYLGDAYLFAIILESWPILARLYMASDRPGDVIVARAMVARLTMMDDPRRALLLLSGIIADARQQGFTDDQLFSVLMDQWAAATLSASADVASAAKAATARCRQMECREDLVTRLADRYTALPKALFPPGYAATQRAVADAFIQQIFPGDFLKLADLYKTGSVAGPNRPIDAARDQVTSFEFAMQARDLAPKDLITRATETMEVLIVAGQYRQALDIGDRAEARVLQAGAAADINAAFWQKRARAGFRMGDARVGAFYDQAVARILAIPAPDRPADLISDLTLDLLDSGFDAPLLRLIAGNPDKGDIRARVYHRQGRHADASAEYLAYRRYLERTLSQPREALKAMFAARARLHLRGQNLDAHLSALQSSAALDAGQDIPPDHPLVYATNALMRAAALQEAYYRSASGDLSGAEKLESLGQIPGWPAVWPGMDSLPSPETMA